MITVYARKITIIFLLVSYSMLLMRCGKNAHTQAMYLNDNFIGIRNGNNVKFYITRDQKTWHYGPGKDFNSPDNFDDAFYFGGSYIGVRRDETVKFYKTNRQGTWDYSPGRDFVNPDPIDGVFNFIGSSIGIGVWLRF